MAAEQRRRRVEARNDMKICQTLWSCYKDLLEDSFGWFSPQHHLMAWAFSCLKLREFYTDIQLYTDSHVAEVLINTLNLPYTKCNIEYDNLNYHPSLWALPKILTYKKQNEPFIHIDGDVFIFEKFNDNLVNFDLIAQNLEVSTNYYKNLFSPIIKKIRYIPEFFKKNLLSKYPKSYNAGILGGNNLELLQNYAWEAMKFVDQNYTSHSNGNINMIFEQLMFYSIAKTYNTKVGCYFDKIYEDNGYSLNEFADFFSIPDVKYLHLIGPLKKNEFACNQLARRFSYEYPDYFERVISLFQHPLHIYSPFYNKKKGQNNSDSTVKRKFSFSKTKALINKLYPEENNIKSNKSVAFFVKEKNNRVLNEVYKYEKKLYYFLTRKFSQIDRDDILNIEKKIVQSNSYLIDIQKNNLSCNVFLNPYIEIIETSFDVIEFNPFEILCEENNQKKVACIPYLFFEGYKAVDLDPISINIISILYEESCSITFRKLEMEMRGLFDQVSSEKCFIRSLIILKLKYLVGNSLIYLDAI